MCFVVIDICCSFRDAVSKNRASSASRSMDKNAVASFVKFHPYSQRLTVLKEPGKVIGMLLSVLMLTIVIESEQ